MSHLAVSVFRLNNVYVNDDGNVFRLNNVYVNDDGNVFNATTLFNKGDCNGHLNFSFKAGHTQVHHVDRAVSLVYRQADAFYHGFIEWQPAFYILHKVLAAHPDIPLLARPSQESAPSRSAA
ncbi:unnamed protein product [Closterium sp. NIES-64]|nr:unnamed protein product [Closterium sp. NIES-64]